MRQVVHVTIATLLLTACGGHKPEPSTPSEETIPSEEPLELSGTDTMGDTSGGSTSSSSASPSDPDVDVGQPLEFTTQSPEDFKGPNGAQRPPSHDSKIKPSKTEAALKFYVVNKEKGPIKGTVIALTSPGGKKFYTEETDIQGYAEVLVPVGQTYEAVYLSLGRKEIAAKVPVSDEPNQNIRLTLRYSRWEEPTPEAPAPRFVLDGVTFDTGKATIRSESLPRFDTVVEFMTHKPSARIEISGHTDNVGNPKTNKTLSQKRAKACKDYLISKGIDGSRIEAVGYGDERPIASNDTEEGRQMNRRIEATEM